MDLVVTDVTEMHHDNYCVAGWDKSGAHMVRPLPNRGNWPATLLTAHNVHPGAIIRVKPAGQANSVYPHKTEDTPIDGTSISLVSNGPQPWFGPGAPPSASSLASAFGQAVETTGTWQRAKKGAYVKKDTQVNSLAALEISRPNLEFFEEDFQGNKSLRAYVTDSDGKYILPVVARDLRELYRAKGVAAVNQSLPASGNLHVRVGLARPWEKQPEKCTVMINGVYWCRNE
jgi:hypothetical protein